MPNWAEGSLKIRGTRQDIKNFLQGALKPCINHVASLKAFINKEAQPEPNPVNVEDDEYNFEMKSEGGFYIDGCRRAFVGNIDWWYGDKHTEVIVLDDFKQAWGVDAKPYAELSKKYNVDLRIYVFEKGMEFNQEIEIHKGEVIKDLEISFDDYDWECVMPNLGG